jgi:hypothetical protein
MLDLDASTPNLMLGLDMITSNSMLDLDASTPNPTLGLDATAANSRLGLNMSMPNDATILFDSFTLVFYLCFIYKMH